MLCATTSCSSRAIRSRSSATALFAAWYCNVTAYRRRCRAEYPVIHAMTLASATGMSSPGPTWFCRGPMLPPATTMNAMTASSRVSAASPERLRLSTVTV